MYRIVVESYENFKKGFQNKKAKQDYRYRIMTPISLLCNVEEYNRQKLNETMEYKKLSDLLFYIKSHIEEHPRFKCLLWTLEGLGFNGQEYGVSREQDVKEQIKTLEMFLRLSYWN